MGTENRRRNQQVKIRLDEDEFEIIQDRAVNCGMTVPAYLRHIALHGKEPKLNGRLIRKLLKDLTVIGSTLHVLFEYQERKLYPKINFKEVKESFAKMITLIEDAVLEEEVSVLEPRK